MKEANKLSPVMQQYLDMKSENPNAVLLFRLGDFYECFFGDAIIVSRALDLVLTHRGLDERGVDIPMCGLPWHASDSYFGRLVKQGISVAIAEQMETPEQAKERGHKQIERKIIRVLTAGTLTDDNLLNPKRANYLLAFWNGEIAACDISTGECLTGQGGIDEITKLEPAEVLFNELDAEKPEILQIRQFFNTTPIHPRQFSGGAMECLAAYLANTQRDTEIKLSPPKKLNGGAGLAIDASTWKSLEIDAPMNDGGMTLLDVLDETKTAAGGRKLRSWLRNLLGDIDEIESRQAHIGHLVKNQDALRDVLGLLSVIPDISRSLARLNAGRGMPRDLIAAREFLQAIPKIKMAGEKLDSALNQEIQGLEQFDELAEELAAALNENLPAFLRDGGIIRRGFSKELDDILDLANGAKDVVANLQNAYAEQTGIASLKIKFNNMLGYFIEIAAKNGDALLSPDSGFIHRQTMAGNLRFTTKKLSELDSEIKSASDRANSTEQEIIQGIISRILGAMGGILKSADLISEIDVYCALANLAVSEGWNCPKIAKEPAFLIKGGRHPVIESVLKKRADSFVKNDCDLSEKSVALITGPNMAGKSTYLRQNALLIILAHLGSFVPADSATIGLCDQLFSRVGASDNLASGQSTFMVEMSETANILNRATRKSFIIFDEIGRGTATWDGMAIAQAVLEFTNNLHPRCLFATHYHELTELPLEKVQNLTTKIAEHNNEVIFLHQVVPGSASKSYGIQVAKMAGMPASVIKSAEQILSSLESAKRNPQNANESALPDEQLPPAREPSTGQLNLF